MDHVRFQRLLTLLWQHEAPMPTSIVQSVMLRCDCLLPELLVGHGRPKVLAAAQVPGGQDLGAGGVEQLVMFTYLGACAVLQHGPLLVVSCYAALAHACCVSRAQHSSTHPLALESMGLATLLASTALYRRQPSCMAAASRG
jgi:hypothetical protein